MEPKEILTSFEGRLPRKAYWIYSLVVMIPAYMVAAILMRFIHPTVGAIAYLAVIYPLVAIGVKRWHDRGKSGWWMLIALVPLIGGIWAFVEAGCLRGTEGPNEYGADPTGLY